MFPHAPDDADEWSFDRIITTLSDTLNQFVDPGKAEEAKKHTRRAIEDIKDEEDYEGLMRATEAVVVHFFEAHLPKIFRLESTSSSQDYFWQMGYGADTDQAGLEDWKAALLGFEKVTAIIRQSLDDDSEADEVVQEFFGPYIKRVEANIWDLESRGPKMGIAAHYEPDEITKPDVVLRQRLHKFVTGLNLESEDHDSGY